MPQSVAAPSLPRSDESPTTMIWSATAPTRPALAFPACNAALAALLTQAAAAAVASSSKAAAPLAPARRVTAAAAVAYPPPPPCSDMSYLDVDTLGQPRRIAYDLRVPPPVTDEPADTDGLMCLPGVLSSCDGCVFFCVCVGVFLACVPPPTHPHTPQKTKKTGSRRWRCRRARRRAAARACALTTPATAARAARLSTPTPKYGSTTPWRCSTRRAAARRSAALCSSVRGCCFFRVCALPLSCAYLVVYLPPLSLCLSVARDLPHHQNPPLKTPPPLKK
jgi:hypothetical protein